MMKNLSIWLFVFIISACNNNKTNALSSANLSALEQTIDMESVVVEIDNVLEFKQSVIEFGFITLGDSRELVLEAINRSSKTLALIDVYTSCSCTKVTWDKKPISPDAKTFFKVYFHAEQMGTFFKKIAIRHSANATPITFAIQGEVVDHNNK